MRRLTRLLGLLLVALCLPADGALADPFPVTNVEDSGVGSLRNAILAANSHTGGDSIPIETGGVIELESALPTISGDVTISGPGAGSLFVQRTVIDAFRILKFGDGVTATVSGVTVAGGLSSAGGGIANGSGSLTLDGVVVTSNDARGVEGTQSVARAAGIQSFGPLTLRDSYVHDNAAIAVNGSSQTVATGGGVETFGALTVERSTISENRAEALGEGGSQVVAKGGGLLVLGGPVTISQSTISGNYVEAAEGSSQVVAQGAGMQGAGATITGSTITGNEIASEEIAQGANLQHFATVVVRGSIVSRPLGDADSCSGLITSGGFNIDEGVSCGFDQSSDQEDVSPGLDVQLELNGGPTPTHALFEGSPALDRGSSFGATVDQRGLKRPVDLAGVSNVEGGDGADVGAFEQQGAESPPPSPATVAVTLTAGDRTAPNTRITRGPARVTFQTARQVPLHLDRAAVDLPVQSRQREMAGLQEPPQTQSQRRGQARLQGAGDRPLRQRRPHPGPVRLAGEVDRRLSRPDSHTDVTVTSAVLIGECKFIYSPSWRPLWGRNAGKPPSFSSSSMTRF